MDAKKIGAFLKRLRKEKGITQEQLAEIMGVAGRTVSRWETGSNLPDLSILVQISEFYEVEIKEILNGERKGENILACAMAIVIQMIITGDLSLVAGETVVFLAGGLAYLYFMVKNGVWNKGQSQSTPKRDLIISLICTGIFSIVFCLMLRGKADFCYVIGMSVCFFIVFTAVSYAVLRGLSYLSAKKREERKVVN